MLACPFESEAEIVERVNGSEYGLAAAVWTGDPDRAQRLRMALRMGQLYIYGPDGFREIAGATLRLAIDVGDWDRSLAMNAPGQSGNPKSEHYSDLMRMWSEDMSIPLLYSREAVQDATGQRLSIEPKVRSHADGDAAAPAVGSAVE